MSVRYVAVNWNRQKRIYDGSIAAGVIGSITVFGAVTAATNPDATIESILIRGLGLTGFLLLHLILVIGPLARLDRRFLPLLYNRRHLGVTVGLIGLAHGALALFQYHALGNLDPFESVLVANRDWTSLANFPFELFGILALAILLVMAATSHDFWLSVLTPPVWKRLHMLVYLAYLALVLHVGLGFLQDERHPIYVVVLGLGILTVGGLHLAAGLRERRLDEAPMTSTEDGWVDVCAPGEIAEGRARIGRVGGERVAIFRHRDRLSCVSNVCRHQNGPLGEGRIIDGCITCPWHGYQYRPESGTSPPPFDDRIATYQLRIEGGRVLVNPRAMAPGTYLEPVPCPPQSPAADTVTPFYVGYQPACPPELAQFTRRMAVTVLLLAGGSMAGLALAQRTFEPATFQFGRPTTVEGTIRHSPYPMLEVDEGRERLSRYLLAAAGKHGAQPTTAGHDGRRVRVTGFLARRDQLSLLEIASITLADPAPAARPAMNAVDLGTFSLEGEIVDSKCYAGVMNPGRGKTHRGCAARCLSGGLTPLFVTTDRNGRDLELIVVDQAMAPVPGIDALAGKPIRVIGRVWRHGDTWLLQLPRQ